MKNKLQFTSMPLRDRMSPICSSRRILSILLTYFGISFLLFCTPGIVHAQPVTVTILNLEQMADDFDSATAGDFFARITINGTADSTSSVDYIDPFVGCIGSCYPTGNLLPSPWVMTQDVPSNAGAVSVRIEIFDQDGVLPYDDDDPADINPGPKSRIDLQVDLATGKWIGDVNWPDGCSVGQGSHSVRICLDISVISSNGDADGDDLLDSWEQNGYRAQNSVLAAGGIDVDLPALGANPLRRDIFVEVDCLVDDINGNGILETADHTHCPKQGAIANVVQAFANAPATVSNPDGTTGIQLHVDLGPLYGAGTIVSIPGTGGVSGTYGDLGSIGGGGSGGDQIPEAGNEIINAFDDPKSAGTEFGDLRGIYFDPHRGLIFRYAIFGHQTNGRQAVNDCTSGSSTIPGVNFFVTLGGVNGSGGACWQTTSTTDPCFVSSADTGVDAGGHSVGNLKVQAGTFMHELGHTLGLIHDGDQQNFDYGGSQGVGEVHNKPNYLSVMNYAFQCSSVPSNPAGGLPGGADYSRLKLDPLDEANLDECAGLDHGAHGLTSINWNGGGLQGATCPAPNNLNTVADTNGDGVCVEPGDDGNLDSNSSGDDFICQNIIFSSVCSNNIKDGGNRVCSTTADTTPANGTTDFDGVDVQLTAVGSTPIQPDVLTGFDDWGSHLVLGPLSVSRAGSSGSVPVTDEADPDTIMESQQYLSEIAAPGVVVDKTGPATAVPGDVLSYAVKITNEGRGPALSSILTDTAPDGTVQTSDLGVIPIGDEKNQTSSFTVPADACPGDFISASASVAFKDFVGKGLTATDSVPLQILDVAAPTLSVSMSPSILWPSPDHKLVVVTATISVQDNCDSNPAITLVSVTSNEPQAGYIGTGDKGPDIVGADIGTDDRSFSVRAERATFNKSTGRIYTIVYQATDASGNTRQATATVTVPKDISGQHN
jgi:uncharacterized repeat protein (TIGR01451 family)